MLARPAGDGKMAIMRPRERSFPLAIAVWGRSFSAPLLQAFREASRRYATAHHHRLRLSDV